MIDFRQVIQDHRDELPAAFVTLMEKAKPKYWDGVLVDRFLELNGHTENDMPKFNIQEDETIDQYFGRLAEDIFKPEILDAGFGFSEQAIEWIKAAPHGYCEVDDASE